MNSEWNRVENFFPLGHSFGRLVDPIFRQKVLQHGRVLVRIGPHVSDMSGIFPNLIDTLDPFDGPFLLNFLNHIHRAYLVGLGAKEERRRVQGSIVVVVMRVKVVFRGHVVKSFHVEIDITLEPFLHRGFAKYGFADANRDAIHVHDGVPDLRFHGSHEVVAVGVVLHVFEHSGEYIAPDGEAVDEFFVVVRGEKGGQDFVGDDGFDSRWEEELGRCDADGEDVKAWKDNKNERWFNGMKIKAGGLEILGEIFEISLHIRTPVKEILLGIIIKL